MEYTNKSIYWVYFFDSQRIETIWDLEFYEYDNINKT